MLTDKQQLWKSYVIPDFAELMIKQLAQHGERGDSWKNEEPEWLLNRAKEELEEVAKELALLNSQTTDIHYIAQSKKVACGAG